MSPSIRSPSHRGPTFWPRSRYRHVMTQPADAAFEQIARETLDDMLARRPVLATMLGDHSFDDRLDDLSPDGLQAESRALAARLRDLGTVDPSALSPVNQVDAEILRNRLETRIFEIEELREHEWNPLIANPGSALHLLLARDFAPLEDRLRHLTGRLAGVPDALAMSRAALGDMPRVHVETSIGQFTGTRTLLATEVEQALRRAEALRREVEPVRDAAVAAIEEHVAWLEDHLPTSQRDPRIGAELFTRKLGLTLDAASDADAILARAEADLAVAEERIAEVAARMTGERSGREVVRRVLDQLAEDRPDDATIVALARTVLDETTSFVREQDLVTVHDDPVEIIVMPEIHRGVAVAYCQPPGPLEPQPLPTFYAISPTPSDWPEARVTSFFREYNSHMVRNLTVHEAMPGHVLQLAHARRFAAPTQVRAAFWSGPFVEGWAVYAEELMAARGFGGDALLMQQLKMQLRMTINTILDARVHAHGITEDEALRLMTERGFQEEGEAIGKWRRALLTSTQLSTYYVGYTEVADLVRGLAQVRPELTPCELHDTVLAHGSPSPRHLRTLLGEYVG
jgi:uncharacterized protein (DUF885 family)